MDVLASSGYIAMPYNLKAASADTQADREDDIILIPMRSQYDFIIRHNEPFPQWCPACLAC